jgi:fumarate hydratase, class II
MELGWVRLCCDSQGEDKSERLTMAADALPSDGTVQGNRRVESDSMGRILVPADRYWGAQTQRALVHFSIGEEKVPQELVTAFAMVKKAAARVNQQLGVLPAKLGALIVQAADDLIEGRLDGNFPLRIWMSGSGTQLNMNVNEVIANRAIEIAGGVMGTKTPVHPNDHVNMSQSTNDVFPTAMNIAGAVAIRDRLIPAIRKLKDALDGKAAEWAGIVKTGRTHMMDAVPLTLGQEMSGYAGMLGDDLERIEAGLQGLYPLALGGTAVGTGLNAPQGFAETVAKEIAAITQIPFSSAPNKFTVQGSHDGVVMMSAVLKTVAVSLYKIANDIKLLASGPRGGLQELILPSNEPGSSIMPAKVNPTQCEVLAMVAVQVMGYDAAVSFAGSGGHLEMNAYKPVMAHNLLQSIRLLSDASVSFTDHLVAGMEPNRSQIAAHLGNSLMLITALAPAIGYDRAAEIVHVAVNKGLTLREAAVTSGHLSAEDFDRLVDPEAMTHPGRRSLGPKG